MKITIDIAPTMSVLRNASGDFTNGGVSSQLTYMDVLVIRIDGELPTYGNEHEFIRLARNEHPERIRKLEPKFDQMCILAAVGPNARPVAHALKYGDRWTMAGGNFLQTYNAICHEALGVNYPISIHDRVED